MQYSHPSIVPELIESFQVGATVTQGQAVIIGGAVGTAVGTVIKATTTSLANACGVAYNTATYSATQGSSGAETKVSYSPGSFFTAAAAGSATTGTALATTSPANVLTNTAASSAGTTITAAECGTVDMDGGYVFGLNNANKGVARVLVTHTDNTSEVVTDAFPYAIAVGDKFVRVPWSPFLVRAIQLTTGIDAANAIIVTATGGAAIVAKVTCNFDESNPAVKVTFMFGDHVLNPI